jgi:hypothetical protein
VGDIHRLFVLRESTLNNFSRRIEILSGVESTPPFRQPWTTGPTDTLALTGHLDFWKHDYDLMHDAGMRFARVPVLMQHVMPTDCPSDQWNWSWYDEFFPYIRRLHIEPIVDLCHHTAAPWWLEEGLGSPRFPDLLTEFALACQKRYPWLKKWTVVNEPLSTALYCGHGINGEPIWHPFGVGPDSFVPLAINVAKAVCMASCALCEADPKAEIFYNDTCEHHQVGYGPFQPTEEDHAWVRFANQRRFMMLDIVTGQFSKPDHPLSWYVTRTRGFTAKVERWFQEHPAKIHCLMLDYYPHHEHQYYNGGLDLALTPYLRPIGFAELVRKHYALYANHIPGLHFMVGETNLVGVDPDKATWSKLVGGDCEVLQEEGYPIWGYCHFGWTDTVLWDSWHRKPPSKKLVGIGAVHLEEGTFRRSTGLFYEILKGLARKKISFQDIPAYRFQEPVATQLGGFVAMLMSSWEWQDPPSTYRVAI